MYGKWKMELFSTWWREWPNAQKSLDFNVVNLYSQILLVGGHLRRCQRNGRLVRSYGFPGGVGSSRFPQILCSDSAVLFPISFLIRLPIWQLWWELSTVRATACCRERCPELTGKPKIYFTKYRNTHTWQENLRDNSGVFTVSVVFIYIFHCPLRTMSQ